MESSIQVQMTKQELELLALGERMYEDFLDSPRDRQGRPRGLKSLLVAWGLGHWIREFGGGTRPIRSKNDFNYVLGKARKLDYADEVVPLLYKIVSGAIKPLEGIPDKTSYPRSYIRFEGTDLIWGLKDTPGIRDILKHKYNCICLRVLNGGTGRGDDADRILYEDEFDHTARGMLMSSVEISKILDGTHDDDIRIEVSYKTSYSVHGGRLGGPAGGWRDFAFIDDNWTELKFQGRDWDGEYDVDEGDAVIPGKTAERLAWEEKKMAQFEKAAVLEAARKRSLQKRIANGPAPVMTTTDDPVVADKGLVFEAERVYAQQQAKNPEWGADWYLILESYGQNPKWGGPAEPKVDDLVAHLRSKRHCWGSYRRHIEELERLGH